MLLSKKLKMSYSKSFDLSVLTSRINNFKSELDRGLSIISILKYGIIKLKSINNI